MIKYLIISSIYYFFLLLNISINKKITDYISLTLDKIYTIWILTKLGNKCYSILIKRKSSFIGNKNIFIDQNTVIEKYCFIESIEKYEGKKYNPKIVIGKKVHIGEYNHITAIDSIVIKDGVLTGRRVTISDNNHGKFTKEDLHKKPSKRELSSKGPVIIGENVWIGENVCILSGVKIGRGSIIAANAVVTKSVPDYCLVAGVPATIIKHL